MQLNPNVVLAGKYIINQLLWGTGEHYVYLAKAPTLGEEFILTEFFPHGSANRDENNFLIMPAQHTDDFEASLSKFANDCDKLMHLKANRLLGIKETLNELGTVFAVTRKFQGDMLVNRLKDNPEALYKLTDNIIDAVYDGIKSAADEKIGLQMSPDSVYVDDNGLFTFMFNYTHIFDEAAMLADVSKLLYFMVTGKEYDADYDPGLLGTDNKYGEALDLALSQDNPLRTFDELDMIIERNDRILNRRDRLSGHIASLILFIVLLLIIAAAAAYGAFLLIGLILGEFAGFWPF
ncbi:MAG: hypothetical protein LBS19_05160 [Clostridiales bacterium]|jgi:hypothetical protein|nr:hypothetical protein [Clostridiales bacterium]